MATGRGGGQQSVFFINLLLVAFCDTRLVSSASSQTIVTDRAGEGGQPPPKCMYSFIVNELDSAKCPLLLQHMYGYQQEQASHRNEAKYGDVVKRLDSLEMKIYAELNENRNIKKNLDNQEKVLKTAQASMETQQVNITNVLKSVTDLTLAMRKQRNYYKDLDAKLAGVIMDVAEVGDHMRKADTKPGRLSNLMDKHIPVKSAALTNTCGLSKNATKFRGALLK